MGKAILENRRVIAVAVAIADVAFIWVSRAAQRTGRLRLPMRLRHEWAGSVRDLAEPAALERTGSVGAGLEGGGLAAAP